VALPVVLVGLGFGLSMTATAAPVWSGLGDKDDTWRMSTARGAWATSWLATALLVGAGFALWADGMSLSTLSFRLAVLAAVAAPSARNSSDERWGRTLESLPSTLLSGLALLQIAKPSPTATALGTGIFISVGLLICGGLATRAVRQALRKGAEIRFEDGWRTPVATYVLLTLLTGGMAFSSLVRYGWLWTDAPVTSALGATWLVWSATWLAGGRSARLHAGLIGVSSLLLVGTALIIG
jgi:hypothetical protein